MLFPFKNSYTSNKFVDVACWKRNKCDIYYEVYYRWFLWFKKKKSNFINQWVWIYKSITSDWKVMINDHIKKIIWLTVTWSIIYTCLALEFFLCLGPKSKKKKNWDFQFWEWSTITWSSSSSSQRNDLLIYMCLALKFVWWDPEVKIWDY